MSWSSAFDEPIALPDGRMLRTLRCGIHTGIAEGKHRRPEWQIAAEILLEAVEGKGPLMFAEIAMRKALKARR